jgi:hypothetical protein
MSMYYSPEIVRALMEERIRDARRYSSIISCCQDLADEEPGRIRSAVRALFRRQSPATSTCSC